MGSFFDRLKRRKLFQWALAYVAAGWLLAQVLDVVAEPWGLSADDPDYGFRTLRYTATWPESALPDETENVPMLLVIEVVEDDGYVADVREIIFGFFKRE